MVHVHRHKVTFQTRIRPELSNQVDELSKMLGLPKTKLTQLALGDLAYKMLAKLPKAESNGFIENYDPESLTDVFIQGRITGAFDYGALGYYFDLDIPASDKSEKEA